MLTKLELLVQVLVLGFLAWTFLKIGRNIKRRAVDAKTAREQAKIAREPIMDGLCGFQWNDGVNEMGTTHLCFLPHGHAGNHVCGIYGDTGKCCAEPKKGNHDHQH